MQQSDIAPYIKDGSIARVRANLTDARYTLAVPAYLYKQGLTDFSKIADFGDAGAAVQPESRPAALDIFIAPGLIPVVTAEKGQVIALNAFRLVRTAADDAPSRDNSRAKAVRRAEQRGDDRPGPVPGGLTGPRFSIPWVQLSARNPFPGIRGKQSWTCLKQNRGMGGEECHRFVFFLCMIHLLQTLAYK